MKQNNSIFRENEIISNKIVAKINIIEMILFTLIFLLNVFGIFIVPMKIMIAAYVIGMICLVIPVLLNNILKIKKGWIKYINVLSAVMLMWICSGTLRFHSVAVFALPIVIATLYYSKKLTIIATILTVIVTSLGELFGYAFNTIPDLEWDNMQSELVFNILPRAMLVFSLGMVLSMMCKRISEILGDLMGAEEQKAMLEKSVAISEKSLDISNQLLASVSDLAETSDVVSQSNQKIAQETDSVLVGATDNKKHIDTANIKIKDINSKINNLTDRSEKVASLSEKVKEITEENQTRINKAAASMEEIHSSTNECRNVITTLGEQSKEIINIVNVITEISSQTNILSLNASIEAARAGEHGRGFAVVAEEIQKLSEQTRASVDNIGKIIKEVVASTDEAVKSMDKTVSLTKSGLINIKEVEGTSQVVTSSNVEVAKEILDIDEITKQIRENSKEIAEYMNKVRETINNNLRLVEQVSSATEESSSSAEVLVEMIDRINKMATQLTEIATE